MVCDDGACLGGFLVCVGIVGKYGVELFERWVSESG